MFYLRIQCMPWYDQLLMTPNYLTPTCRVFTLEADLYTAGLHARAPPAAGPDDVAPTYAARRAAADAAAAAGGTGGAGSGLSAWSKTRLSQATAGIRRRGSYDNPMATAGSPPPGAAGGYSSQKQHLTATGSGGARTLAGTLTGGPPTADEERGGMMGDGGPLPMPGAAGQGTGPTMVTISAEALTGLVRDVVQAQLAAAVAGLKRDVGAVGGDVGSLAQQLTSLKEELSAIKLATSKLHTVHITQNAVIRSCPRARCAIYVYASTVHPPAG